MILSNPHRNWYDNGCTVINFGTSYKLYIFLRYKVVEQYKLNILDPININKLEDNTFSSEPKAPQSAPMGITLV